MWFHSTITSSNVSNTWSWKSYRVILLLPGISTCIIYCGKFLHLVGRSFQSANWSQVSASSLGLSRADFSAGFSNHRFKIACSPMVNPLWSHWNVRICQRYPMLPREERLNSTIIVSLVWMLSFPRSSVFILHIQLSFTIGIVSFCSNKSNNCPSKQAQDQKLNLPVNKHTIPAVFIHSIF